MGFWSVLAMVTGCQVGSGIFMLPATLAPYGLYSIVGWVCSALGAIMLSLVFAKLCAWFPKTGGPHVYVKEAFGQSASFFTGWTYWVISWVSTTVVVIGSIGYLMPILGIDSLPIQLVLQLILLLSITLLNCRGLNAAGHVEFVLTVLKVIPLLVVPLCALFYFNGNNFSISETVAHLSLSQILSRVTLLTLWGFIGLESATTAAESVENPTVIIPRAVLFGTIAVTFIYLLNNIGIMGVIPGNELMNSAAPYADAVRSIFGGNWHLVISIIASIVCIGTLNAWMMTSGQIALGLAQDNLLPSFFGKKNSYDAPIWSLIISSLGMVPLLIMTANKNLASQILTIIDFSVIAFLFVYVICCLSFLKILLQKKQNFISLIPQLLYGIIALLFCSWVIYETSLCTIAIASLFVLSGIPFYLRWRLK